MRLFNQQDGLASVFKNKKMGCVNKNGKLVIPCIYDDDLFNFRREGYCIVAIKNGKEVYLDKNGKITSGPNNTQTNKSWIRCLTEEDKDLELKKRKEWKTWLYRQDRETCHSIYF